MARTKKTVSVAMAPPTFSEAALVNPVLSSNKRIRYAMNNVPKEPTFTMLNEMPISRPAEKSLSEIDSILTAPTPMAKPVMYT